MRILYLHQYFNLPADPGGTRSYEMARRLVAKGHEVFMITSDRRGKFGPGWHITEEAGIQVHWLNVPYSNKMSYKRRIQSFRKFAIGAAHRAASIPADVVFATSTPLTIAIPGVYASKRQGIPMVFEVRDLWPELPIAVGALKGPLVPPARLLERFAYRNSERIVALSPGMKAGIVRTGYPEGKVHVVPNSSDLDLFNVGKNEGDDFRKQFTWLQERPLVIYAGTLGKINGVSYLAHLAYEVEKLSNEIRFLVMGDGAERALVKETAKRLGVFEKNFFMMEPVPKYKMPAILSATTLATSLFVNLPEMWANSANKFFDALASGTPVAINYYGWQAELLSKNGGGIVLSPVDFKKAARDMVTFLNNRERLNESARTARYLAKTYFGRDKLADDLENVLIDSVNNFK